MPKPTGYTGYYPGEKIPRPPGGRRPQPPDTYDLNVLAKSIEGMNIDAGNIPRWAKEQIQGGIDLSFKANVYSTTLGGEDIQAYGREEIREEFSELSGTAGITVDLNPLHIAEDPQKWFGTMGKKVYDELISIQDMESRERGALWGSIVGVRENGKPLEALDYVTRRQALHFAGVDDYKDVDRYPLNLVSIGAVYTTSKGKELDLGRDTAVKIVDFAADVSSVFARDGNFDKVMNSYLDGSRRIFAHNILEDKFEDLERTSEALSWVAKLDMERNQRSVDEAVEKIIDTITKGEDPEKIRDKIKDLNEKIEKSRLHHTLMTSGSGSLNNSQLKLLGITDEDGNYISTNPYGRILKGRTTAVISSADIEVLSPHIEGVEKVLSRIEKAVEGVKDEQLSGTRAYLLVRRLSSASSDLTGSGTGIKYHSVNRRLKRHLVDASIAGKIGGVRDGIRPEDLLRGKDESGYEYHRRLRMLIPTLERKRRFFGVSDGLDAMYRGNAWNTFLWAAKINPRLKAMTPGYWVGEFMTKMHYFGLVIDEKALLDASGNLVEPKFFLYRWVNKAVHKAAMFKNKFRINIEGIGSSVVKGGKHFGAVKELDLLITKGIIDLSTLKELMKAQDADAIKSILENIQNIEKYVDMDKLGKLADKIKKFSDWVKKNASRLGIDLENGENIQKLIRGLMIYDANKIKHIGIGITKAYRGKLHHLAQKLSVVQNKIFSSFAGKIAAKFVSWKMAISAAISEVAMDALAVVTGGVGILAKPLEIVLQAAVKMVLDVVDKLFKSVVKADLSEIGDFLDKSMTNVVKLIGQVIAIITLGAVMPFLLIVVFLSALTPENNAKIGAVGGPGGPAGSAGPGTGSKVPEQPPVTNIGGCPVQNGRIWLNRYSYGYESPGIYAQDHGRWGYLAVGHGTNNYWGTYRSCYRMPGGWVYSNAPRSHSEGRGVCSDRSPSNIYYGMAADFTSDTSDSVYIPELGDPVGGKIEWNILGTYGGSQGSAVSLTRSDGTNTYRMIMLHLNLSTSISGGQTREAGDFVGTLWGGNGSGWKHVHIELVINGIPVRPENYFCL